MYVLESHNFSAGSLQIANHAGIRAEENDSTNILKVVKQTLNRLRIPRPAAFVLSEISKLLYLVLIKVRTRSNVLLHYITKD